VGNVVPLAGDTGTTVSGQNAWKSRTDSGSRGGIALSLLSLRPTIEQVNSLPKFPYGHPRDTRITIWTQSGNLTFLVRDLEKGPILAPEYGFFVAKAGSGKTARDFTAELAASNTKSIREMTRNHREVTWDEAMREIALPMLPPGTTLPPYKQVADPPMEVGVPETRWQDAWRIGVSQLRQGELTYMDLALEAPRPIHDMDLADYTIPRLRGWTAFYRDLALSPTVISPTDQVISASAGSFMTWQSEMPQVARPMNSCTTAGLEGFCTIWRSTIF